MNRDELNDDETLRFSCLELAINANSETEYNDNGSIISNPDKVITAAQKFYDFVRPNEDKEETKSNPRSN